MIAPEVKVEFKVAFSRGQRGRKRVREPIAPASKVNAPASLPRITRLMALAIRFDQLIRDGEVADYAEIARLGHVTRARVTQIMNLLLLAPDLQDTILHLPPVESGRDAFTERDLRPIAAVTDWRKQRRMWTQLIARCADPVTHSLDR